MTMMPTGISLFPTHSSRCVVHSIIHFVYIIYPDHFVIADGTAPTSDDYHMADRARMPTIRPDLLPAGSSVGDFGVTRINNALVPEDDGSDSPHADDFDLSCLGALADDQEFPDHTNDAADFDLSCLGALAANDDAANFDLSCFGALADDHHANDDAADFDLSCFGGTQHNDDNYEDFYLPGDDVGGVLSGEAIQNADDFDLSFLGDGAPTEDDDIGDDFQLPHVDQRSDNVQDFTLPMASKPGHPSTVDDRTNIDLANADFPMQNSDDGEDFNFSGFNSAVGAAANDPDDFELPDSVDPPTQGSDNDDFTFPDFVSTDDINMGNELLGSPSDFDLSFGRPVDMDMDEDPSDFDLPPAACINDDPGDFDFPVEHEASPMDVSNIPKQVLLNIPGRHRLIHPGSSFSTFPSSSAPSNLPSPYGHTIVDKAENFGQNDPTITVSSLPFSINLSYCQ